MMRNAYCKPRQAESHPGDSRRRRTPQSAAVEIPSAREYTLIHCSPSLHGGGGGRLRAGVKDARLIARQEGARRVLH